MHTWTLKELANLAYQYRPDLKFRPGYGWEYSNTNYILVGMIIESITGHSFSDEINKRMLNGKLGLINTYYLPYPKTVFSRLVHGYDVEGKNAPRNTDVTSVSPSRGGPAGALISNSHDTALWAKQLFGGSVLKPRELNKMIQLVSMKSGNLIRNNHGSGYGLGIGSDIEQLGFNKKYGRVYDHNGAMLGYQSYFVYVPCYDIIIALTTNANRKNAPLEKIAGDMIAAVVDYQKLVKHKTLTLCH